MGAGRDAQLIVARAEWRTRWRSYLVLAVVAGLAVGAVVATLLAATRSENAFHRLRAATRAADVSVFVPDVAGTAAAARAIEKIDGVRNAAPESELFVRPAGSDYFPDYDLYARAPVAAKDADPVNTPVITTGRAADPRRADEVVLSERLAAALGVTVGDTITLESMTAEWVDAAFNGAGDPGPPDGPKIDVDVVGLSRTPADFARWKALIHLTPAFERQYRGKLNAYPRVEVQLTGASRKAVRARLLTVDEHAEVSPSPFADDQATDDGLATIAIALRLIAAVAALAGAVVVGLVITRIARLAAADRGTLAVLGWTRHQLAALSLFAFAPWLLLGVGAGLLGGVIVSPHVLVGLARRVDPVPGSVVVDPLVVAAVGLSAVAIGLLVAWFAGRGSTSRTVVRAARPTRVLSPRRPLPAVLGVRHALGGEPGRGGRASRSAVVVSAAAVAGAVAALVVSASISHLLTDPSLTGQGTSRVIDAGESIDAYDRALPILEDDRRVAMLAGAHVVFGITAGRDDELTALAYDVKRGRLGASVVDGRIPRDSGEVALGPVTLERLEKHIGDRVRLHNDESSASYRIVGKVLFPEGDFDHDAGAALTTSGARRLIGNVGRNSTLHQVVFQWADGVEARRADRTLAASGLRVLTNARALNPASVTNLGQVETLPRYLAVFLAILSLVTVGYALWTSVRARAGEFATLRALGMTPRSLVGIVATQALTIVGIAFLVGVPVGVLVGGRIWTPIANGANVVVRSIAPGRWLAVLLATMAVVTVILASIPAWQAFRVRAPDALRAE